MLSTIVMTVIGPDRPGLVEAVAARVADHGGNWLESRMCRLGGQFAGIVRVEVDPNKTEALVRALNSLEGQGLHLALHVEPAGRPSPSGTFVTIDLVGQDRPGILLQISRVLAHRGINVEDLSSERVSAPMDGNMLFQAKAKVFLPPNVPLSLVRADLEKIAGDLMVDIELQPAHA